jgi:microcystin-dependent protein
MTANRIFPAGTEDYSGADYMDKVKEEGDKLWTFLTVQLDSVAGTNAITAVPRVPISSYVDGMKGRLIPANTNTGAVTMDWGPGAKDVLDASGQPLTSGALVAGVLYVLEFISADDAFRVVSSAGGGGGGSGAAVPTGTLLPFAPFVAPAGFLMAFGQAVSRTTYATLFAALFPILGAATISIASPGDVTLNGHGLSNGDRIRLFTTGALPTGLNVNTDYYLVSATANTFQLASTPGGAAINTSGSQSGTHTVQYFPYGAGNGSTTFNLPDVRGVVLAGRDNMGGTAANRLSKSRPEGIAGRVLGIIGGAQDHQIIPAELAAHQHTSGAFNGSSGALPGFNGGAGPGGAINTGSTGGDQAHNNVQPTIITNVIIKT